MRKAAFLLLLLAAGCSPFSGTRYADIPAEQYNYLKAQRVPPEKLGIQIVNRGSHLELDHKRAASGDTKVTVPLRLNGGAVTTPVMVNGTMRVPAVIDTGAPFNLASLTLAYRLDLPITRPQWLPQRVGGYGGASAECGWSILNSLDLGGMAISNCLAMVPLEKFERVTFFGNITVNHDQFIILGLDEMIRSSFTTFDFPRGRFTVVLDDAFIAQDRNRLTVPFTLNPGPRMMVSIKVDGKGPYPCLIDTGKTHNAPALTIPQKVAQELGYWKETGGKRSNQLGIGGSFESQRFRIKTFDLGGQSFPNLTADSHERAGEFILGVAFLRQYRTTFDFRTRTIHLEK